MRYKQLLFVMVMLITLSSCGFSSKKDIPDISGNYSFGDNYRVEIAKSESNDNEAMYSFVVKFNIADNDFISGEMTVGTPYYFDEANSLDSGTLVFSYESNTLFLELESELHGNFKEELLLLEKPDYSSLDTIKYCKEYYSPTEMYGISLSVDELSGGFYVDLNYSTGLHDEGTIIPGEETTLVNGAIMTLEPQSDGGMYITLYSAISADGNFEEYLIEGNLFDIIDIPPAMLGQLGYGEAFSYLCNVEKNCMNMDATTVVNNPLMYCNNEVYRFTGEVIWSNDEKFLLKITDELENNLISCYYSDENMWVPEGSKVCVYGTGMGTDSYSRRFSNDVVREYTTLAFDVGYILYQEEQYFDFTNNIDIYSAVKSLIYGTYKCDGSTPYLLESEITIDESTINGRPYTVDSIYIDFAATSVTTALDGKVYLEFNIFSMSKRSAENGTYEEYPMSFQFALDGSNCNFGSMWFDQGTYATDFDYASYVKKS